MMDFRHSSSATAKNFKIGGEAPGTPRSGTPLRTAPPRPVPITIIGAGPFGLSVAAYLRGYGIPFRIIGSPMQSWLKHMPNGMLLKSTGYSSTLYDPDQSFTIARYCKERGIPHEHVGLPVKVETFSAYGLAFQKALVPEVEDTTLVQLSRDHRGFMLELADGRSFTSERVVLGIGLDSFRNIPGELSGLPPELVTHSAAHNDLTKFRGQDVAVIGGGSSAIDTAVLLHEAGARPVLIVRKPKIEFGIDEPLHRPLLKRLHRPMSGIGPGWKNRLCADAPWAFRYLPDHVRTRTVSEFLGPSGGWFMKQRTDPVPQLFNCELKSASETNGRLQLRLSTGDGTERNLTVDHAIAATGYRPDVHRLPFLSTDILRQMHLLRNTPRLSAHFESSVPGLYFIGPISANTFGPVMRFAVGADFTSRRLSKHLARVAASQRSAST